MLDLRDPQRATINSASTRVRALIFRLTALFALTLTAHAQQNWRWANSLPACTQGNSVAFGQSSPTRLRAALIMTSPDGLIPTSFEAPRCFEWVNPATDMLGVPCNSAWEDIEFLWSVSRQASLPAGLAGVSPNPTGTEACGYRRPDRRPIGNSEEPQTTDLGILRIVLGWPAERFERAAVLAEVAHEFGRRSVHPKFGPTDQWAPLVGHPLLTELEATTVALIGSYPKGHVERLRLLDEWCTWMLFSGDRAMLQRCLPLSAELREAQPHDWTVAGTRGSVLLVTGHATEGTVLLELLMTNAPKPYDRAISACCLAWAAHQRGDMGTRQRWWVESLRCNDGKPMIGWMAREIGVDGAV